MENRLLLERARAEALAEVDRLGEAARRLREDVGRRSEALGAAVAAVSTPERSDLARSASLEDIRRRSTDLRRDIETLRGQAERLTTLAGLRDLSVRIEALATDQAASDRAGRRQEAASRAVDAARILGRAPPALDEATRADLQARAEAFVAADAPGRARGLEAELRRRVQTLQQAEELRRRRSERAAELRDELLGLEGPEAAGARRRLDAAEAAGEELGPDVVRSVREAASAGRRRLDRVYAMEVLRDAFQALGYEVGPTFDTVFLEGGEVAVSRPDRNGYAVEIGVDPVEPTLSTRLVRTSDRVMSEAERRLRDREAEEGWCGDYARVLADASRRKVQARVTRRTPAGAEPVPAAAAAAADTPPSRRQAFRSAPRARAGGA